MSDTIIWVFLLFVFLIIIGLYTSEYTPLDLTEKQKVLSLDLYEKFSNENFAPSVSSNSSVIEGASRYYNWGLPDNNVYDLNKQSQCDHKCNDKCISNCPLKCSHVKNITINNCTPKPNNVNLNEVCAKCDITQNQDIDKYVLKSSVPPCPDMSEYITKNMMNANHDLSNYILKSEIKPCDKVDITNYILKSEIPACPNCPVCPECPICPICPPQQECKQIHQYDIMEHPSLNNYISKSEVNQNYIKKSDILSNPDVQNYLNQYCPKQPSCPVCPACQVCPTCPPNQPCPACPACPTIQPKNENKQTKTPIATSDIFSEDYQSELLRNDVTGYYVGDSAFSGF